MTILPLLGPLVLVLLLLLLLITLLPMMLSLSLRVLLRARPDASLEEAGSVQRETLRTVLSVIPRTIQSCRRSGVRPVSTSDRAGISKDPGS